MTHMAIDQYGQTEHDLGPHPRKELLSRMYRKSAQKIYRDTKNGTVQIGWIIAKRWFTVFQVKPMEKPA